MCACVWQRMSCQAAFFCAMSFQRVSNHDSPQLSCEKKNQAFLIFQIPFHVVPYQIQNMDIDISVCIACFDSIWTIKKAFFVPISWTKQHYSCFISFLILLWALFIKVLVMWLIKLIIQWILLSLQLVSLNYKNKATEVFQNFTTVIYFLKLHFNWWNLEGR